MLKAPLRYPKEIPNYLFYHKFSGPSRYGYDIYNMLSVNSGKKTGFLVTQTTNSYIENYYEGKNLIINFISATPMYNGNGQKVLDFAKNLSKRKDCNGHLLLKADISFTPHKIPHLFYRKNGFSTLDKKLDKKMDRFIKEGKDATYKDFPCLMMYYPAPEKYPPQNNYSPSLFTKIKNFLGRIF